MKLEVYDVVGRRVRTFVDRSLKGGEYRMVWDRRDDRAKGMSSGIYFSNLLLGNVCKLNVASLPYHMAQLAVDIAGGIVGTLPSEKDFLHSQVGKYLEKYLRGVEGAPTAHRVRIIRLIENLLFGPGAVGYVVESMQGAAPPAAQKSMLARLVDFEHKKGLARSIAGIE